MKPFVVKNRFSAQMKLDLKCEYCGHIVRNCEIDLNKQSYNIPAIKCLSCNKSSMDIINGDHEYVI